MNLGWNAKNEDSKIAKTRTVYYPGKRGCLLKIFIFVIKKFLIISSLFLKCL